MRFILVPLQSGNPIEIQRDVVLVGRHHESDLRLDHRTVSKIHCLLVKAEGMLLLRDLASTNGCRVNHQRTKRAAILSNDILSIAGFDYRVEILAESAGMPVPSQRYAPQVPREATEVLRDDEADDGPLWLEDNQGQQRIPLENALEHEDADDRIPVDSGFAS